MAYTTKEYIIHVVCLCLTTVLREREVAGRAGGQVHVDDQTLRKCIRVTHTQCSLPVREVFPHVHSSHLTLWTLHLRRPLRFRVSHPVSESETGFV